MHRFGAFHPGERLRVPGRLIAVGAVASPTAAVLVISAVRPPIAHRPELDPSRKPTTAPSRRATVAVAATKPGNPITNWCAL